MIIEKYPSKNRLEEILKRPVIENSVIIKRVKEILNEVKLNGDRALRNFSEKFDKVLLEKLCVTEEELNSSSKQIPSELKDAINTAYKNIFKFHSAQKRDFEKVNIDNGITCWRKNVPIQKVGLYIPGGSSPLFSTLLMLGIPAKIADCSEIIVCTPPQKDGTISSTILYVAQKLGIEKIFKVGGAQAIAAMAFGTESILKVDKIFGPGNQWVTTAKQIANSYGIAIDMPAGPSEVLVIADDSASPKFVASDLLSQAEHGPDSQSVLISTSYELISKTIDEINKLKIELSRIDIINKSLKNCRMILVNRLEEAIEISNYYAPEHLILSVENPEEISEDIINAGSVFLGNYSPESVGDYASGTNHTLPTNGFASAYSGVSLDSFFKTVTFQKLEKEGLKKISSTVEIMAVAEGLDAHKLAVKIRGEE